MINIILKQWQLTDKRLAAEMLRQLSRGVARDMSAKPEGMQLMIDLVREDSKVSQPFTVAQIVDYSFLAKSPPRPRCAPAVEDGCNAKGQALLDYL